MTGSVVQIVWGEFESNLNAHVYILKNNLILFYILWFYCTYNIIIIKITLDNIKGDYGGKNVL